MNTWPGGRRKALHQSEHEDWNARHYPGTRQLCSICDGPTGRCEEDSMYIDDDSGPVCERCFFENSDEVYCEEQTIAADKPLNCDYANREGK